MQGRKGEKVVEEEKEEEVEEKVEVEEKEEVEEVEEEVEVEEEEEKEKEEEEEEEELEPDLQDADGHGHRRHGDQIPLDPLLAGPEAALVVDDEAEVRVLRGVGRGKKVEGGRRGKKTGQC